MKKIDSSTVILSILTIGLLVGYIGMWVDKDAGFPIPLRILIMIIGLQIPAHLILHIRDKKEELNKK